jgi:hypothetical protein
MPYPFGRGGDADQAEEFNGLLFGLMARHLFMYEYGLCDLVAYGEDRIERGHRLLKDHGNPPAPEAAQVFLFQFHNIPAVEQD